VADGVDHRVDVVVAQRLGLFGGLKLGGDAKSSIVQPMASISTSMVPRWPEPGLPTFTRLPLRSSKVDAGIGAGDDGERLGVDREDGAQAFEGALLLEARGAVVGVVLPVGLRHAEFQLAAADGVDVEDRAAGRFHAAADAVLGPVAVHQAADRAAGRVIDARHAAGADRDEGLILRDECRREFQSALRRSKGLYGRRAEQLAGLGGDTLIDGLRSATHANLDEALSGENVEKIKDVAKQLLKARRIYCVGVRSCFSLAHYLAYTGGMAFRSFERPLVETGSIADTFAYADPGDIAILITFSLYSAEVVRAHEAALSKGVEVIAITDSYASPIARKAKTVFCLPMAGPQSLPSHGAGFALAEAIVAEMIAQSADAPGRIARFEDQMIQLGNYVAATK
jgi:DNA-binding MurR/RpiR family transcriptional regulator